MMLAAVYHGPLDLRIEQVPVPKTGPGEVLLRIIKTGICGTDLRIYHGTHRKFPPGTIRIPGHELVGEIVEVGGGAAGLSVGQTVFMAPNMGCGHCRQCISGNNNLCANYEAVGITRDGSFAEFMLVPSAAVLQGNLIPLSAGTDLSAAALIEPFACVLRGQNAVSILPGDTVLVMGAGPIGIMHMLLAKFRGAKRVIVSEISVDRAAQAAQLGADRVVNPAAEDLQGVVEEDTAGQGMDVILVAAPAHQAQESALSLAGIGGRINFFGGLPKDRPFIQLDSNVVHYKELRITGTTACSTHDCWQAADIVQSKRVNLSTLVSGQFALTRIVEALQEAEAGRALKILLEPNAS
jgi:L-iditol 2-dehydrogenase